MGKAFNIAALIVTLALAVGVYMLKTEADSARAKVEALQAQVAEAKSQIRILAAENAQLESPERIDELAREKLGLAPAQLSQHHALSEMDALLPPAAPKKRP